MASLGRPFLEKTLLQTLDNSPILSVLQPLDKLLQRMSGRAVHLINNYRGKIHGELKNRLNLAETWRKTTESLGIVPSWLPPPNETFSHLRKTKPQKYEMLIQTIHGARELMPSLLKKTDLNIIHDTKTNPYELWQFKQEDYSSQN